MRACERGAMLQSSLVVPQGVIQMGSEKVAGGGR